MPSDAAVTCSMMPQPTPATAATPPRKPSCVERATISAVSGPGVTLSSQPAKMKIRRSCVPSIFLCRPRSAEAGAVVRRGEVELRTERRGGGRGRRGRAPGGGGGGRGGARGRGGAGRRGGGARGGRRGRI